MARQAQHELDALDSAALASSDRDAFSRDMLVSMALWKAISDRYDLLEVDLRQRPGRRQEAERISALVWGRLDVAPGSAAGAIAPSVRARSRSRCRRPAASPTR